MAVAVVAVVVAAAGVAAAVAEAVAAMDLAAVAADVVGGADIDHQTADAGGNHRHVSGLGHLGVCLEGARDSSRAKGCTHTNCLALLTVLGSVPRCVCRILALQGERARTFELLSAGWKPSCRSCWTRIGAHQILIMAALARGARAGYTGWVRACGADCCRCPRRCSS